MNTESTITEVIAQAKTLPDNDLQTVAFISTAELAARWISHMPDVQPHINAGAGIEVVMTMRPTTVIKLFLANSDDTRILIGSNDFKLVTKH